MSTNLVYRARERQRKRERRWQEAKLKNKKGDRDLGQEIKKKQRRHFLVGSQQQENFVAEVTK